MAKKALRVRAEKKAKFKVREYNRCQVCARSHSVLRKFKLCRICFRKYSHMGLIPGIKKAS